MSITIWHNPRCSKSRQTLQLLTENGLEPLVRLYLVDNPDRDEIDTVATALGLDAKDFVRKNEPDYKLAKLTTTSTDAEIRDAMVVYPKLIERPIVITPKGAVLGRPPENVLSIL